MLTLNNVQSVFLRVEAITIRAKLIEVKSQIEAEKDGPLREALLQMNFEDQAELGFAIEFFDYPPELHHIVNGKIRG